MTPMATVPCPPRQTHRQTPGGHGLASSAPVACVRRCVLKSSRWAQPRANAYYPDHSLALAILESYGDSLGPVAPRSALCSVDQLGRREERERDRVIPFAKFYSEHELARVCGPASMLVTQTHAAPRAHAVVGVTPADLATRVTSCAIAIAGKISFAETTQWLEGS